MAGDTVVLETDRLWLRPWRVSEAAIQRELWTERDPRVPAHRRIDADGHPTVADIEEGIRAALSSSIGLLAVERKVAGDVIGYCGLVDSGRGAEGEPELAYELLRRSATNGCLPRSGTGTPHRCACWPSSASSRPTARRIRPTGPTSSPRDGSDAPALGQSSLATAS